MKRGSASFEQWVDHCLDPEEHDDQPDPDAARDWAIEQRLEDTK
jgi:hypothetical protein